MGNAFYHGVYNHNLRLLRREHDTLIGSLQSRHILQHDPSFLTNNAIPPSWGSILPESWGKWSFSWLFKMVAMINVLLRFEG